MDYGKVFFKSLLPPQIQLYPISMTCHVLQRTILAFSEINWRLKTGSIRTIGVAVPFNHTSWVSDRPKPVRNRCVIELFCDVCVVTLTFSHFCWCRGFCHRTESDLFLFLFLYKNLQKVTNYELV